MSKLKKVRPSKELKFVNASDWSSWLKVNHDMELGVWVVFSKKTTNEPTLTYEEALDIALAYGWIDISIRKIDERRFGRKFTPRRPASVWSQSNIDRAEQLIRDGRMTKRGLAAYNNRKSAEKRTST